MARFFFTNSPCYILYYRDLRCGVILKGGNLGSTATHETDNLIFSIILKGGNLGSTATHLLRRVNGN